MCLVFSSYWLQSSHLFLFRFISFFVHLHLLRGQIGPLPFASCVWLILTEFGVCSVEFLVQWVAGCISFPGGVNLSVTLSF